MLRKNNKKYSRLETYEERRHCISREELARERAKPFGYDFERKIMATVGIWTVGTVLLFGLEDRGLKDKPIKVPGGSVRLAAPSKGSVAFKMPSDRTNDADCGASVSLTGGTISYPWSIQEDLENPNMSIVTCEYVGNNPKVVIQHSAPNSADTDSR